MVKQNPLNNINTLDLLLKIEEFKKLDLRTATMEEVLFKLLQTLRCMNVYNSTFQEGTRLYRIRRLHNNLSDIPKFFQDIWHPQSEIVRTDGRANLKGQPMLYTSLDKLTPVYECGINESDCYALIQYVIRANQKLVGYCIGIDDALDDLNETGKINDKIINDFLSSEFGKPVGIGTEYLYKTSNAICINCLDMPDCDAYVYPSIANYKKGWNLAIKPNSARQKIEFSCLLICISKGFTSDGRHIFELKHKANALNNDVLIYEF